MLLINYKRCNRCKIKRSRNFFNKDKSKKDGLHTICKECKKDVGKQYRINNKDKILEIKRQYRENNKVKIAETNKKYRESNKGKVAEIKKQWKKEKLKNDPIFRLTSNIRTRFCNWLNVNKKSQGTFEYIDCTKEELVAHLERSFQEGMSWKNYGLWHVDHKVPLSLFDPTKEEDMYKAWAKENLQPLWAKDNLKKGNKLI